MRIETTNVFLFIVSQIRGKELPAKQGDGGHRELAERLTDLPRIMFSRASLDESALRKRNSHALPCCLSHELRHQSSYPTVVARRLSSPCDQSKPYHCPTLLTRAPGAARRCTHRGRCVRLARSILEGRRSLSHQMIARSEQPTTREYYARILGDRTNDPDIATRATTTVLALNQDPWQEGLFRSFQNNPYRDLSRWYVESSKDNAMQLAVDDEFSNWGISYQMYVEEYVSHFAELIPLQPGDRVFESGVGSGWLIRALLELKQRSGDDEWKSVEWYGNDILPVALQNARRSIPDGQFFLGDSANLSWVPREAFDLAICGYIETSPNGEFKEVQTWVGNWVAQMARLVRPGGSVCLGAVDEIIEACDLSETINTSWWEQSARSDVYSWGVDPDSVTTRPLRSKMLKKTWGPRYCISMTKRL